MASDGSVDTKLNDEEAIIEEEEEEQSSIQLILDPIIKRHHNGTLPLTMILFVIIYNFIIFSIKDGYEIYLMVPPLFAGYAFYTKYWITNNIKLKWTGIVSIFLAILWDAIVSITFIPSDGRGYSLESLPTIILDFFGIISLLLWRFFPQNQEAVL